MRAEGLFRFLSFGCCFGGGFRDGWDADPSACCLLSGMRSCFGFWQEEGLDVALDNILRIYFASNSLVGARRTSRDKGQMTS